MFAESIKLNFWKFNLHTQVKFHEFWGAFSPNIYWGGGDIKLYNIADKYSL